MAKYIFNVRKEIISSLFDGTNLSVNFPNRTKIEEFNRAKIYELIWEFNIGICNTLHPIIMKFERITKDLLIESFFERIDLLNDCDKESLLTLLQLIFLMSDKKTQFRRNKILDSSFDVTSYNFFTKSKTKDYFFYNEYIDSFCAGNEADKSNISFLKNFFNEQFQKISTQFFDVKYRNINLNKWRDELKKVYYQRSIGSLKVILEILEEFAEFFRIKKQDFQNQNCKYWFSDFVYGDNSKLKIHDDFESYFLKKLTKNTNQKKYSISILGLVKNYINFLTTMRNAIDHNDLFLLLSQLTNENNRKAKSISMSSLTNSVNFFSKKRTSAGTNGKLFWDSHTLYDYAPFDIWINVMKSSKSNSVEKTIFSTVDKQLNGNEKAYFNLFLQEANLSNPNNNLRQCYQEAKGNTLFNNSNIKDESKTVYMFDSFMNSTYCYILSLIDYMKFLRNKKTDYFDFLISYKILCSINELIDSISKSKLLNGKDIEIFSRNLINTFFSNKVFAQYLFEKTKAPFLKFTSNDFANFLIENSSVKDFWDFSKKNIKLEFQEIYRNRIHFINWLKSVK